MHESAGRTGSAEGDNNLNPIGVIIRPTQCRGCGVRRPERSWSRGLLCCKKKWKKAYHLSNFASQSQPPIDIIFRESNPLLEVDSSTWSSLENHSPKVMSAALVATAAEGRCAFRKAGCSARHSRTVAVRAPQRQGMVATCSYTSDREPLVIRAGQPMMAPR